MRMRDMSSHYFTMSVKELKTLRSKKILALERERKKFGSYSSAQEVKRLNFAINRIDSVIAAKEMQLRLTE